MDHGVHTGGGAVAAGHAQTAQVGASVLERGGNAVDAVVGMCFAACVAEGTLTSLGGGGFMIVGGAGRDGVLLDFFARQPGLAQRPLLAAWESFTLPLDGTVLRFGTGPASVGVPGMAAGLTHASRRFGRLPLTQTAAPAAQLAADGVKLTATQAGEHHANFELLTRDPQGDSIYRREPGGPAREAGERFCQPQLAASIEEIAATAGESFYRGGIARRLMQWSDGRGGRISREDLEAYEVVERRPLELRVGDVVVETNPAPSMGGRIICTLLEQVVGLDDATSGRAGSRGERDERVAEGLLATIARLKPPLTHPPDDGEHVSLFDEVAAGARGEAFASSPNTTHVAAIDADGMVASATTTVGFGAGEYIPGTGIQLNNMLAEYDHRRARRPGTPVPSMMSPTILVSPRRTVTLGSAGSDRIPQALAQILERMWTGTPLAEAIAAPRFVFDGHTLHAEPGFADAVLDRLATRHDVVRWPGRHAFFGTANGVASRDAQMAAAGDPRREAVGLVLPHRG